MEFTFTFWSWLGLISNLATLAVSLAIFLVMQGVVRWRRTNFWLSLFLISIFGWVASGQFTNFLFWLNQGDPLFSFCVSLAFFSANGVILLAFIGNIIGLRSRALQAVLVVGVLGSLAALLPLFRGLVVTDIWLNETGLLRYHITPLGYALSTLPFVYQFGALGLSVYHRDRVKGWIALGVAALMLGPILSTLRLERWVGVSIPYSALGTLIGISSIGYTVARRQVFDPLHQLTFELEHQVAERTRALEETGRAMRLANESLNRHAAQLDATIQITNEVAYTLNLHEMLHHAVELIRHRLGYSYVALYLIDDRGQWAELEADAGKSVYPLELTTRRLRVGGNTPVGHATATGEARQSFSVSSLESVKALNQPEKDTESSSASHSLSPGAPSGVALPLKAATLVIGALYLQSNEESTLDEEEVAMLQTLADHLTASIENARLLHRTQVQLDELTELYRRYSRQMWQKMPTSLSLTYRQGQFQAMDIPQETLGLGQDSRQSSEPGGMEPGNLEVGAPNSLAGEITRLEADKNLFTVPVNLRGETVGVLGFRKDSAGAGWSASEQVMVEAVVSQMSLALENARLLEEAQTRAARERLTSQFSARMRESLDLEAVLKIAASEMCQALGLEKIVVNLTTEETDSRPPPRQ